jgi:very-short-patch-repair endonuclease
MRIDHVIAQIAARQYGLVELSQLAAAGVRRHYIETRLRAGSLERLRAGVFVVAGAPRSFEQSVLAAVLAAGPHAVASHTTAAVIWGLPFVEHDTLELSTARPHWARMPGVRAHRTTSFLSCEHTAQRRIPVTTVSRTLVDLSGSFTVAQLGRMTDRTLRKGQLRLDDLRKCVAGLLPAPGRRPTRIQRVLRRRLAGYEPGDSDLEMRFVRAIVAAGLPEPELQHRVVIGTRRYRIDMAYPDLMLAMEIDGWEHHRSRTAFDEDRARANDLVVGGWRVLRFTSTMSNAQAAASVAGALSQKRSA